MSISDICKEISFVLNVQITSATHSFYRMRTQVYFKVVNGPGRMADQSSIFIAKFNEIQNPNIPAGRIRCKLNFNFH